LRMLGISPIRYYGALRTIAQFCSRISLDQMTVEI
jgi:hypothetical protein